MSLPFATLEYPINDSCCGLRRILKMYSSFNNHKFLTKNNFSNNLFALHSTPSIATIATSAVILPTIKLVIARNNTNVRKSI